MALSQAVFLTEFGDTAAYSPDYYVYVRDSTVISSDGFFNATNQHENIYYQQFPILTLMLSILSTITNLDTMIIARMVTTALPLLLVFPLYVILKNLFNLKEKIIVITLATATILVNLYLLYNLYTGTPAALGVYAMLMTIALILIPRPNPRATIFSGTLLGVLVLVHGLSSITVISLMILFLTIRKPLISRTNSYYPFKVNKSLLKMIVFITLFYVFLSSALIAYSQGINSMSKYFEIVLDVFFGNNVSSAYTFYPSSIMRGYQDYLSAPTVAFVISSTIAAFITHVFYRKIESDLPRLLLFCISTLALLLLGIAAPNQLFSLKPGVTIGVGRYFGIYAFGLATIPTAYVLYKIGCAASKSKVKFVLGILLIVLVIGVQTDPMILPLTSTSTSPYTTVLHRSLQSQLDGVEEFLKHSSPETSGNILIYPYHANAYLEAKNVPSFRDVYPIYQSLLIQVNTNGALVYSSGQVFIYNCEPCTSDS